jgi:putative FmdB family regulatory protein
MPTYSYLCTDCNLKFELFFYMNDYNPNPVCEKCQSLNTKRRFTDDAKTINGSVRKADSELTTIGDIANRNRDKLSADEKHHLDLQHNSYREDSTKDLPRGMSRMKDDSAKLHSKKATRTRRRKLK